MLDSSKGHGGGAWESTGRRASPGDVGALFKPTMPLYSYNRLNNLGKVT